MKILVSCSLLLVSLSLQAAVGIIAGPVTNPGNGHTYYLLDTADWTNLR